MGKNVGRDKVIHACGHEWRWQIRRKAGRPDRYLRERWAERKGLAAPTAEEAAADPYRAKTREERLAALRARVCPRCFAGGRE